MLVVGDREAAESTVSVRSRAQGDLGSRTVDKFVQDARAEIESKGHPDVLVPAGELEAK